MSSPATINVKISSDAGEVSQLTRVGMQQMPLRELVERMLGYTAKNEAEVQRILGRGSLVSGAIRMRWEGIQISRDELQILFTQFPDPDPTRQFAAENCTGSILSTDICKIEIPRDVAAPRRFLKKRSYWDLLMDIAAAKERQQPQYVEYSYRLRSDRYRRMLLVDETKQLKLNIDLLTHQGLARRILETDFRMIELFTSR